MHEHGIVDRHLAPALEEAARRGGALRGLRVRLGALAASTPERLRADLEHVLTHHPGLAVALEIEEAPEHPAGVELIGVDLTVRSEGGGKGG